ncbi:hypothetical protein [uncultured Dokdonia sp.]|uniref:hypothetical protein n=1 Tax=uncultured Dokdonia sp. TaxID=575653 RepID=UPI0030ED9D0F|tara:strand:+ start:34981 stop:36258 length:1278 start_codon:yes stop_codon:yes gene_type:complete
MKHLALLFIGLLTFSASTYAAEEDTSIRRGTVYDGSKYIFVENGIEFSVFPDGEFDFYIPQYVEGVSLSVNAGPVGISFNTGFDYDPYVQYDEYGAVIQVEDTPLYYDNYGRLAQAGDVRINYRDNRISRVGGLQIYYNNRGLFSHYTGFINVYNRNYVFHPYHNYYYRPVFNRCLVFNTPYRRYYTPVRYNYAFHRNNYSRGYNRGYANARRDFRRPDRGRVAHNNGRRDNVDRNNARFTRANTGRVASRANTTTRRNNTSARRPSSANTSSRNGRVAQSTSRNGAQRGTATTTSRRSTNKRAVISNRNETQRGRPTVATTPRQRPTASSRSGNSVRKSTPRTTRPTTRTTNKSTKSVATNRGSRTQSKAAPRTSQKRAVSTKSRSSSKVNTQRSSSRKAAPQRTSRSSNSKSSRSTSTRSRRG